VEVHLPPAFPVVALLLSTPGALPEAPAFVDGSVMSASQAAVISDSIVTTEQY
jgi:hypothetical protein